jgi:hypothetical protein
MLGAGEEYFHSLDDYRHQTGTTHVDNASYLFRMQISHLESFMHCGAQNIGMWGQNSGQRFNWQWNSEPSLNLV